MENYYLASVYAPQGNISTVCLLITSVEQCSSHKELESFRMFKEVHGTFLSLGCKGYTEADFLDIFNEYIPEYIKTAIKQKHEIYFETKIVNQ